jgi:hypothetical protein
MILLGKECSMSRYLQVGLASCLLVFVLAQAKAQESASASDVRNSTALRFAPADSAFFSTSLRMKDRCLRLWNTKAVQQIWKTPLVQAGWQQVIANFHEKGGPLQELLKQPENQQLLELLGDMVSEEFFVIGGANTPRFLAAMMSGVGGAYSAGMLGRLGAFGGGGADPGPAQARAFLHGLMEKKKDLVTPELVIGFKIKDEKVALKQINRLEVLLNGVAMMVPQLTGKVKRQKTGDLSFATVIVDGATMNWDKLPWDQIEEEKGEFDDLIAHLKKMKLTISLGNYQGYLILAFGESLNVIEHLGKGKKLAELPEFQPLAQHSTKPITNVGYVSKVMNSNSGFTKKDADEMRENLMELVDQSPVSDEFKKRLEKDIPEFANDLYKLLGHDPGASVSFAYETGRGEEGYSYQYSVDPSMDASKPLSLLQHVGGDPVLAVAGRYRTRLTDWDTTVKWCKKIDGYLNDFIFPDFLGKEGEEHAKKVMASLYPLFKRFDKNQRENFYPALMDGQWAFVIDNKLVSTQWHKALPEAKTPLPLLEPAIVAAVSDADKLKKGAAEVRSIFNDGIKVLKDNEIAELFQVEWPAPESRKVEGATLYWYTFPDELMLDGRLMPTAGVSQSVAALTVSNEHAIRLLKATPLKVEGGPLSDTSRKASSAAVFSLSALVDTALPWVDFAMAQAELPEEVTKHKSDIKTILSSLRIFRRYSSTTSVENGATVTHSEWHLRDID